MYGEKKEIIFYFTNNLQNFLNLSRVTNRKKKNFSACFFV